MWEEKTYRYALVVVDGSLRYKDAEALTSKDIGEVSKAFEKMYARKLEWPHTLMVDPGKEFMGNVTKTYEKAPGNYTAKFGWES